jgi:hypothetical protein
MIPRIFVGGTGRSGTWILYRTLGSHREIHTFPTELRFIVDPGGLVELVNRLTINFSPALARDALVRFDKLMREQLASFGMLPYAAIDLPNWLGGDYYWLRLDQFITAITALEHKARYWTQEKEIEGTLKRVENKFRSITKYIQKNGDRINPKKNMQLVKEARYYSIRAELVSLASLFVDDLLQNAAKNNKKNTWCEKTPQNLLHLDFIWELFPESYFIHIKRDPRGVVYSLSNQIWGPNTIVDACKFVDGVYSRWFDLKSVLDFENHRYFELKLEDLANTPSEMLEKLTTVGGFDNQFENPPEIIGEKVNYWKKTISKADINYMNDRLGSIIENMGYEL